MIPHADSDYTFGHQDIENHVQSYCPYGCPKIEIDSNLAKLIAVWPRLDRCNRAALLGRIEVDGVTDDDR